MAQSQCGMLPPEIWLEIAKAPNMDAGGVASLARTSRVSMSRFARPY